MRSSETPERLALLVELGFDPGKMALRARLDFGGGFGVEAFDRRELARLDIGDLLDRAETLGGQELGHRLVDVERIHEGLRALGEFLLAAFGFLGFGQDVDVPAGQLRGEAHVLPAPADRQRKLIVGNDDLDAGRILVEHDLHHLGRLQRVDDEGRGVRRPGNDVDLLALQFVDDRLHA